jgi:zinc protease
MGDLRVAASDLAREKPRIDAELANMFGRMPQLGAMNHARELVRPTPAGGRKGGVPEHVRAATLEEVQGHWRRYYKPKNALLVLAGGFDAAAARKAIETRFGKLPAGEPVPAPSEPEKGSPGTTRVVRVKPLGGRPSPEVCLAYAAPAPGSDLFAPYLVLVARLQADARKLGLPAGRFPVICPLFDDPAAVFVAAPAKEAETAEQAVKRLGAFVEAALKPPLDDRDVANVRAAFGPMLGLDTIPDTLAANPYFVAFTLGLQRQLGIKPAEVKAALAKLRDEDLRRAVKEVFGADRRGAAFVAPEAK